MPASLIEAITITQVADLLRIPLRIVRSHIRKGYFPAIKEGGRFFVPKTGLEDFIRMNYFGAYRRNLLERLNRLDKPLPRFIGLPLVIEALVAHAIMVVLSEVEAQLDDTLRVISIARGSVFGSVETSVEVDVICPNPKCNRESSHEVDVEVDLDLDDGGLTDKLEGFAEGVSSLKNDIVLAKLVIERDLCLQKPQ